MPENNCINHLMKSMFPKTIFVDLVLFGIYINKSVWNIWSLRHFVWTSNMIGRHSTPPKWSAEFCACGEQPVTCNNIILISFFLQQTYSFLTCNWLCYAGFVTCCLPCITFGQIAEIVDEGRSCKIIAIGILIICVCWWFWTWEWINV